MRNATRHEAAAPYATTTSVRWGPLLEALAHWHGRHTNCLLGRCPNDFQDTLKPRRQ
jgi:hypothetical protein